MHETRFHLVFVCALAAVPACSGNDPTKGSSSTEQPSDSSSSSSTTSSSSSGAGGVGGSGAGGSGGAGSGMELLHADFQKTAPGKYAQEMVEADFGSAPTWNNGLDEGRAVIIEDGNERFLRVTYPANEYGPGKGGVQFMVNLKNTYEDLYLSYRVRFGSGHEFVKGGKLPGLVGGSAPTGCVNDTNGFSARMMWRTGGEAVQYMYFPEKVNNCGDDYGYTSGGTNVVFQPGMWHRVEHRLVMNTPGKNDGILQAWFDGTLVLDEQAFVFRLEGASYGIDALYFSTFYGGSDSSWAPMSDQVTDFDDFIVSTGPISH